MLFRITRLIFGGIVFIICFFLIKKSRVIRDYRWRLISFIVVLILVTICGFFPIENAFMTFSSPEAVFNYTNTGDVELVVNGMETDFVVATNGKTVVHTIVPKTSAGWKLGIGIHTRKVTHKIFEGISVYVFQYRNSKDYYIKVYNVVNGRALELSDNRGSEFYDQHADIPMDETSHIYYAYVRDFNEQYVLTVNGDTYSIAD